MDKNKFWLGGTLFNTASPRLGAPMQRRACPQVGHPNATQGTSASWAPQRNPRHVRKLGAPMHIRNANARHVRNARHVCTFASWAQQCNTRHVRKLGAPMQHNARLQVERPNAMQGTSTSWAPQRTSTTQTQGTSTHPQVGRENETQGTSARWSPKRKTHPQQKHPHKGALG